MVEMNVIIKNHLNYKYIYYKWWAFRDSTFVIKFIYTV